MLPSFSPSSFAICLASWILCLQTLTASSELHRSSAWCLQLETHNCVNNPNDLIHLGCPTQISPETSAHILCIWLVLLSVAKLSERAEPSHSNRFQCRRCRLGTFSAVPTSQKAPAFCCCAFYGVIAALNKGDVAHPHPDYTPWAQGCGKQGSWLKKIVNAYLSIKEWE